MCSRDEFADASAAGKTSEGIAESGAKRTHLEVCGDSNESDTVVRLSGSCRAMARAARDRSRSTASDRSDHHARRPGIGRRFPGTHRVRRLLVTPLPPALGGNELVAWRLDSAIHASTWASGEGAFRYGGRWNTKGVRAVYCSIDPATAILEVAVHKGFRAIDTVAHVMTSLNIPDALSVHVVQPAAIPDPAWLRPGIPGAGQQVFGEQL